MNKKGMTLIEILVSILIISIVMTIMVSSLPRLLSVKNDLEADNKSQIIIDYIMISNDFRYLNVNKSRLGAGKYKGRYKLEKDGKKIEYILDDNIFTRIEGKIRHKTRFNDVKLMFCPAFVAKECVSWRAKTNSVDAGIYEWWKLVLISGSEEYPLVFKGF